MTTLARKLMACKNCDYWQRHTCDNGWGVCHFLTSDEQDEFIAYTHAGVNNKVRTFEVFWCKFFKLIYEESDESNQ